MGFPLFADVETESILDLKPDWFQARGIKLFLLDFDNTVVAYRVSEPSEEFLAWRREVEAAGITLMIVSNSRKSRRVPDFCEKWDMPYIRHAGKPNPKGVRRAMDIQGFGPEETALAGDQTFTDVLGANLAGVTSVLVKPIRFSNPFQAVRHGIEQPFIRLGRRKRQAK